MELNLDVNALSTATREVMSFPGMFKQAKLSALKSTGWMIQKELRGFVESSGAGSWVGLHPVTQFFYKKYGVKATQWVKSRRISGPMAWLGKFSRYRISDDLAVIGFGKSPKGVEGTINPFLMSVIRRAELGAKTQVTSAMRRMFGATRLSNTSRQQAGSTFFPIKKTTPYLETKKRPIFEPILARIQGDIAPWFEDKFWLSVTRQKEGLTLQ